MSILKVRCMDRLRNTMEFAKRIGLWDSLKRGLKELNRPWFGSDECILMQDFADHSFYFVHRYEGKQIMNGGLIFHGPHDNGGDGGPPTFSVCLTPHDGWAIHT